MLSVMGSGTKVGTVVFFLAILVAGGVSLTIYLRPWDTHGSEPEFVEDPSDPIGAVTFERTAVAVPEVVASAGGEGQGEIGTLDATQALDVSANNRAAIEALEAGDLERAVALLEECVAARPDEAVFARNLAEALARLAIDKREREHRCADCLALLERAHELAPEREDIAALLERWRAEAELEDGFWRDRSTHFELSFDGERDAILTGAPRLIEVLEEAYTDLSELFVHYPAGAGKPPIEVVLYEREGFSLLTGLGDWAAGAFDGRIRIPVGDLGAEEGRLREVLRHELVHAFVREVGGTSVPGWLNEGVAQKLEGVDPRVLEYSRQQLIGKELFPLDRLGGSLASWQDTDAITLAYHQSLAFCEYLHQQYGERVLIDMIKAADEGGVGPWFQQWTGVELDTALADFAATLR